MRFKSKQNKTTTQKISGVRYGKSENRKFISKLPLSVEHVEATKNSDSIVKTSLGMKSLAVVADVAAKAARQELADLQKTITESLSDPGRNFSGGTKFSEFDAIAARNSFIEKSLAFVSTGSLGDKLSKNVSSAAKCVICDVPKKSISKDDKNIKRPATPDVDYAELAFSNKGIGDTSSVNVVFTVTAKEAENIKAFRIFRSKKKIPEILRPVRQRLSRAGIDFFKSNTQRTRDKNFDKTIVGFSQRLDFNGIKNALSDITKVDGVTGLRVTNDYKTSVDKIETRSFSTADSKAQKELANFTDANGAGIDLSVIRDINSLRTMQLINGLAEKNKSSLGVGKKSVGNDTLKRMSIKQLKSVNANERDSSLVVRSGNYGVYKELSMVPLARLKKKMLGGLIEFSYCDPTVELGSTYLYYITSVGHQNAESVRSKITKITIENIISPPPPENVIVKFDGVRVAFSILTENNTVEKFEVYRKRVATNSLEKAQDIRIVGTSKGFSTDIEKRDPIENGFIQVGESSNSRSGSSFYDMSATPGHSYIYRIYSIDHSGNKSQDAKEIILYLDLKKIKKYSIRPPVISVEIDAKTKKAVVLVDPVDENVSAVFVARKDLSLKEKTFTIPSSPSHIRLGNSSATSLKTFEGSILRTKDNAWNGHFQIAKKQKVSFIDKTTRTDHIYQYNVYSVDRFGNQSDSISSRFIFLSGRQVIESPVSFSAKKTKNTITLSWKDGALDIMPEELIGDRDELARTGVRTLFQVERKKSSASIWEQFPLTDLKSLEDVISQDKAPQFRPQYLDNDSTYYYRVAAYQTGGFISNFADQIEVSTFSDVLIPINFRIKACDVKCEPFVVALNWDTDDKSGTVDKWIIERAVLNNFAAAKINISNVNDVEMLSFTKKFAVNKESSRSRSRSLDITDSLTHLKDARKTQLLTGMHHFIDSDVTLGNTYFYRIHAVGIGSSNISNMLTRGIKLADASFQKKLNAIITQNERNSLADSNEKLEVRNRFVRGFAK